MLVLLFPMFHFIVRYISVIHCCVFFFFCKQKTAYEMRISDWSSDVCSSDLTRAFRRRKAWIAILCMAGVVSLAALDVMPIGVAAIIAIGVIQIGRASCRERVCQYV